MKFLSVRDLRGNSARIWRELPDENDNSFMEVALSSDAACLVTGNLKYFPEHCRAGVRVLAPREFLDFFRKRNWSK